MTPTEIKDGVYDEKPADYVSADAWWEQCVRDHLAALPHIEQPSSDNEVWMFTDPRNTAKSTADGRCMLDSEAEHVPPTSTKHTIETLADDDARQEAALAAVEHLRQQGEMSEADSKKTVYDSHHAGYESPDEWWKQCVRDILEEVPGIEQAIPGEIWIATQAVNVEHEGKLHQTADENIATSTEEEEDICPVCQRQYSGQVVLETNETALSGYPLKRCIKAGTADTSDGLRYQCITTKTDNSAVWQCLTVGKRVPVRCVSIGKLILSGIHSPAIANAGTYEPPNETQ